jgi:hypothetical protein
MPVKCLLSESLESLSTLKRESALYNSPSPKMEHVVSLRFNSALGDFALASFAFALASFDFALASFDFALASLPSGSFDFDFSSFDLVFAILAWLAAI